MKMKLFAPVMALVVFFVCSGAAEPPVVVPAAGNSYNVAGRRINIPTRSCEGFVLKNASSVVDIYFRVGNAGSLNISLIGSGAAVNVSVDEGTPRRIVMSEEQMDSYPVGRFDIAAPRYVKVRFQSDAEVEITGLLIGGQATEGKNNFCTEAHLMAAGRNWQYWSRRGPSTHMSYPTGDDVEYFYNELTVPEGSDVIGSYYMTNGFGEGYCGFQVNGAAERRVLFSVWSPFETDDPDAIPEELDVILVRKGEGTLTGEFGNEGSGGQSYVVYPWKAGVTYRVLTRVRHCGESSSSEYPFLTEYTGYFFDPEEGEWRLIASWRRPTKSRTTYTRAHSFLENFYPTQGWITRECYFGNQWMRSLDGRWTEVTRGRFTYDNTALRGLRSDYYGGMNDNRFMLRNCGFFDVNTAYRAAFDRQPNGTPPDIDFEALELL